MTPPDPRASLGISDITITLTHRDDDGHKTNVTLPIETMSAAGWLELLWDPDLNPASSLILLLGEKEGEIVKDLTFAGKLDEADLFRAFTDTLSAASGRDWWVTLNIALVAAAAWDSVGGALARSGCDPNTISIGQWTDLSYAIIRDIVASNEGPRKLDALILSLHQKPRPNPTEDLEDETTDMDEAEFLAAVAGTGDHQTG